MFVRSIHTGDAAGSSSSGAAAQEAPSTGPPATRPGRGSADRDRVGFWGLHCAIHRLPCGLLSCASPGLLPCRLRSAHPQSVLGVGLPLWPPSGVVVVFDFSRVNGFVFALQISSVARREGLLQAAGLPADAHVEIYLRDLPWALPPNAAYDLLSSDVIVCVPFASPAFTIRPA